jgi:hypothetical protein
MTGAACRRAGPMTGAACRRAGPMTGAVCHRAGPMTGQPPLFSNSAPAGTVSSSRLSSQL